MGTRWARRVLAPLFGLLLVVASIYVATIPSIAGGRQQVQVAYSDRMIQGRDSCAKAIETFDAKALIGHEHLFGGGMSVAFCYRIIQGPLATDLIIGKPTVNTWADARWGWSFDGISSKVRGHGKSCASGHCWEYFYYRYYFKFTRNLKIGTETCTPFVNITVRGNGSYVTGHSDGGVC